METDDRRELRLRPFVREDDEIVSSWFADAGELRTFAGPRLVWPVGSDQWEALRQDPGLSAWTAVLPDDDTPVGHGELVQENEHTVRFARIAIAPHARGKGLGRPLGLALIAKAREAGFAFLSLNVHAANVSAIRTYRGLGFGFTTDADEEHMRRMELDLQEGR